jgi:hypothetical protein
VRAASVLALELTLSPMFAGGQGVVFKRTLDASNTRVADKFPAALPLAVEQASAISNFEGADRR